ncbi:SPOR domain-containing protein [Arcobacter cloacae]|uniref:SPOR domain-containing protein n=1 Tax=Arcobacter cloacae TaxID=1054034 RepID=A0A6M8NP21_9BACT|nr:SPOR domain-containing protein [Arcobacter cloacae]QKF89314.1 SPOR domain-containing protein [Arcobacter cloacae]RXI39037.1 SPOR domain-containing protein [Arcobacter cloacae]
MQIKGEEFIRKVQIQQEREELERKLSELEDVDLSINNININHNNESVRFNGAPQFEPNEHELDNIMLNSSGYNNDENKKKYLILGIVLVVLFLLTIIIIRLLTNDPSKEDSFTANSANSSEIKKLSENNNIEENFQKIINERVKKDSNEPMIPENALSTEQRLQALQQVNNEGTQEREIIQEEEPANISNETIDETIRKIEEKKTVQKEQVKQPVEKKTPVVKETVEKKVETKKSVRDLVDNSSSEMVNGFFIQVGAFTRKPSDSYINTIRNAKFKYKIYQEEVKGTVYNKVLIGPYSTRAAAAENIEDVKQKLDLSSAFIVKF